MTERMKIISSYISSGKVFADIGCDHGYISKWVLDNNKFEKVIISDISAPSLQKAVELLKPYGNKVIVYLGDGFESFKVVPDECLIAGMGGEEIIKILKNANALPNSLVLAPQKNTDKVRETLIMLGYKIQKDFTFYSQKKYYDLIRAEKGKDSYTLEEIEFGRDNLKEMPKAFTDKIKQDVALLESVLSNDRALESSKQSAKQRLNKLKGIIKWTYMTFLRF